MRLISQVNFIAQLLSAFYLYPWLTGYKSNRIASGKLTGRIHNSHACRRLLLNWIYLQRIKDLIQSVLYSKTCSRSIVQAYTRISGASKCTFFVSKILFLRTEKDRIFVLRNIHSCFFLTFLVALLNLNRKKTWFFIP